MANHPTRPVTRPIASTYRDGVGALRCATCFRLLLTADDRPAGVVRWQDIETILTVLHPLNTTGAWTDLIDRLTRAIGRPPEPERRP